MILSRVINSIALLAAFVTPAIAAPAPKKDVNNSRAALKTLLAEYGVELKPKYLLEFDPKANFNGTKPAADHVLYYYYDFDPVKLPELAAKIEVFSTGSSAEAKKDKRLPLDKRDYHACHTYTSNPEIAEGQLHSIKNPFCDAAAIHNVNYGNGWGTVWRDWYNAGVWYPLRDRWGNRVETYWWVKADGITAWNWNKAWNGFWSLIEQCEWENPTDYYLKGGQYTQQPGFYVSIDGWYP